MSNKTTAGAMALLRRAVGSHSRTVGSGGSCGGGSGMAAGAAALASVNKAGRRSTGTGASGRATVDDGTKQCPSRTAKSSSSALSTCTCMCEVLPTE